jgi:hypothetical protein
MRSARAELHPENQLGEQDSNLRVSRVTGERLTTWLSPIESRLSGDNLAVMIAA